MSEPSPAAPVIVNKLSSRDFHDGVLLSAAALQKRTIFRSRFANRGYINSRIIDDGALVLTNAAPDAQFGPDVRTIQHHRFAIPSVDFHIVSADRFRRNRTHLFTHHARRFHGPWQAPTLVDELLCQQRSDHPRCAPLARVSFQLDLLDCSCGAHFAAQRTVQLAESHRHIHHRCPQAFDASLRKSRGLQHVGGAHVDALIALDAAFQKLAFFNESGGRIAFLLNARGLTTAERRIAGYAMMPAMVVSTSLGLPGAGHCFLSPGCC